MAAAAAAGGQRGIFGMDQERVAQALALTWGELYQDTGVADGRWQAGAGTTGQDRRPDDGRQHGV